MPAKKIIRQQNTLCLIYQSDKSSAIQPGAFAIAWIRLLWLERKTVWKALDTPRCGA